MADYYERAVSELRPMRHDRTFDFGVIDRAQSALCKPFSMRAENEK